MNNARYALNAANARWGSLYDALYGSDVIDEAGGAGRAGAYNPVRGERVFAYANVFLDQAVPLAQGQYADIKVLSIHAGKLHILLESGSEIGLRDPAQCIGYLGEPGEPTSILLVNNGLHIEIQIDRQHYIGKTSGAGVKDVVLESALSTIQDCEDSVAAVDAQDKVLVYRNWLGLMKGDLEQKMSKAGNTIVRKLNADRFYRAVGGGSLTLPGRSLMLVRNVGAHMYTDAVTDAHGAELVETFIDAMVTSLCAMHDLCKSELEPRNSRQGSVYIVKPKQHGPGRGGLVG